MTLLRKERAILIDILRILLCAGVVLFHYHGGFIKQKTLLGDACVATFFFLSAFLATCYSQYQGRPMIYIYNRMIRILPVLFLVSCLSVLLNWQNFIATIKENGITFYFIHLGHLRSLMESYNVAIWFIYYLIIYIIITPLLIVFNNYIKLFCIIICCILSILHYLEEMKYVPLSQSPFYYTFMVYILGILTGQNYHKLRINKKISYIMGGGICYYPFSVWFYIPNS